MPNSIIDFNWTPTSKAMWLGEAQEWIPKITNVGQSDVNLSPLTLPCSRILLVQGEVRCLPCGEWASYLPRQSFLSSKEKISQQKSNHQPFYSELGTSPLSPSSLGSS